MDALLKSFDVLISYSPLRPEQRIKAVIGKFFEGFKSQLEIRRDGCCQPEEKQREVGRHRTHRKSLLAELPEVLTFNLNWPDAFPKASSVLKTLLSLPE